LDKIEEGMEKSGLRMEKIFAKQKLSKAKIELLGER
jgi:hypothetical protein